MRLTVVNNYPLFTIYINKVMHLRLDINSIINIQSWKNDKKIFKKQRYSIELYMRDGRILLCEYIHHGLWINILDCLDGMEPQSRKDIIIKT